MVKTARRNLRSIKQRRTRRRQSKSRKQSIKQLRERRQRRQSQKPRSQRRTRRRKRILRGGGQDKVFAQTNFTQLTPKSGEKKGKSLIEALRNIAHRSPETQKEQAAAKRPETDKVAAAAISPETETVTAATISSETETVTAAAQPVSNEVKISEKVFIDLTTRKEMSGKQKIPFPENLIKISGESLHTIEGDAVGVYKSGGQIFKFFNIPEKTRCPFTSENLKDLIGMANDSILNYVIEYLNYGTVTIKQDISEGIFVSEVYFYIIMNEGTTLTYDSLTKQNFLKIFENIHLMNEKGFIHGDIKLENIVKIGEEIKFIDYEDTLQYNGCRKTFACRDLDNNPQCPNGIFQIQNYDQLTVDMQGAFFIYLFIKLLNKEIISNMEEFTRVILPYFKQQALSLKRLEGEEEIDEEVKKYYAIFKSLNNANFLEKMTEIINADPDLKNEEKT